MNIYQKLIEVRKSTPYLQKESTGNQYKYVGSSQVLASLKDKMDELQLLLIPKVTNHKVLESVVQYYSLDPEKKETEHVTKRTTTYFTEIDMTMTWVNAEKPEETIECPWYGQGVDIAGEKGVGKALTYAEKYFMLKFFNIPTDKDDPDSFQQKHEDKPEQKPQPQGVTQAGALKPLETTQALKCSDCGVDIPPAVKAFSEKVYHKPLCMKCQAKAKNGQKENDPSQYGHEVKLDDDIPF